MVYSEPRIASTWWIVFLCVSMFTCSCREKETALPYYNTPQFDPVFLYSEAEVASQVPHQISEFSFTNQHGKTITQQDVEGRIHVANFIFTSCMSICPKMTNQMKRVSAAFHHDPEVIILSYSVTPWIDSVARLKNYAAENQITSPSWHLLTGNKTKIYELARTSYFAEEDMGFTKDSTEFLHTEHILLVDHSRRIRGIYNGTLQLEIEQLIKDIQVLKNEKAD